MLPFFIWQYLYLNKIFFIKYNYFLIKIMKKYMVKIFSFVVTFVLFVWNIYALNAELKVDKNNYNINDYINLVLEVEYEESWKIEVKNIKNLDKFNIVSQSQSNSSRTNIIVVNWKTKSKKVSKVNLNLVLKANQNWEFEIWPAILQNWSWTIESNSVKIKVGWSNLNVLQNNSTAPKKSNEDKDKNEDEKNIKSEEKIDDNTDYGNNYELYILLLVLFLSSVIFYFLLNKSIKNKNMKKTNISEVEKVWNIKENKPIKITYPKIEQPNFINEITTIFKNKIWEKYSLEKIENLTLREIVEKIPKNSKLEEVSDLLNKAKYSESTLDNKNILELVKNIKS